MLLLIMCRDLEVADRRMTTAIKLVLAQAFVAGATALVPQLVCNGVLHRRPLPERGPPRRVFILARSCCWNSSSWRMSRLLPCPRVALVHWVRKAHTSHSAAGNWAGVPGPSGRSGHLDR